MSARKVILALTVLLGIIIVSSPLPILGSALRGEAYVADTVPEGKPRFTVRKTGTQDTKSLRKKSADLKDQFLDALSAIRYAMNFFTLVNKEGRDE